jgi:hypothetical protein
MKPYALHSKTKLTAARYNNYASYLQMQFKKMTFFQFECLEYVILFDKAFLSLGGNRSADKISPACKILKEITPHVW